VADKICWAVPGILGTELWTGPGLPDRPGSRARKVWCHYGNLVACLLSRLDISAPLVQVGSLHPHYGGFVSAVRRQLDDDWQVRPMGYDWRRDIREEAAELVEVILATEGEGIVQHSFVCHSMGGLIARACIRLLAERGRSDLVGRLVTVGTPHRGSYVVARIWAEQVGEFNDLVWLKSGGPLNLYFRLTGVLDQVARGVHRIAGSWPSTYQLLPALPTLPGEVDPLRPITYDPATWARSLLAPSAEQLAGTADWYAWLADPRTVPPPGRFVSVAGDLEPTPSRIRRARFPDGIPLQQVANALLPLNRRQLRQLELPSWDVSVDGDGAVTTASALHPQSQRVTIRGQHGELWNHPAVRERLRGWLTGPLPAEPGPVLDVPAPVFPPRGAFGEQPRPLPSTHDC